MMRDLSGVRAGLAARGLARLFGLRRANLGLGVWLVSAISGVAVADTAYYVDYGRSVSGNGTAASPWSSFSQYIVNWNAISNNLRTGNVKIYMSSRMKASGVEWTPYACGPNTLSIVGDELYNTNQSGAGVWYTETTGSRATLSGGGFAIPSTWTGFSNLVVKGLIVQSNGYAAFNFSFRDCCGTTPPFIGCCSTNIHGIHMTNCAAYWITGPGGYLFFAGNNTTNCYDFVMSGCQASNVTQGALYTCRYSYLPDTVTNWVIESNTFWNCCRTNLSGGPAGDSGVINVKPGTYGCIIQYNLIGRDPGIGGGGNGIFGLADHMTIRGNTFIHMDFAGSFYGSAIFVSTGGDAQGNAKTITGCDIYNNLIVGNANYGIYLDNSSAPATMSGVTLWNNTIVSNLVGGATCSTGVVIENNIFQNNGSTGHELLLSASPTTLDYNLYFRSDGAAPFSVNSISTTWAQWQALGYDAHGTNADPLFTSYAGSNFSLQTNSPAKGLGVPSGFFNTDLLQTLRPPKAWDAGAIESLSLLRPPSDLRVVGSSRGL